MSNINSTTFADHLTVPRVVQTSKAYRRFVITMHKKGVQRRTIRLSLLLSNVVILIVVGTFILLSTRSTSINQVSSNTNPSAALSATANPLDQVSSAQIALTVARMTSLPETTAIANQAQTQAADLAIISNSDDDVLAKPQVVFTALKSRADIFSYVTQNGDTPATLAARFGVTSNSILWSNGLTGTTLPVGEKIVIPPINGIVYTIKAGDTPASLATHYNSNAAQIVAYNDAEISGLQVGEQIIIPNGTPPTAPVVVASVSSSAAFPWGSGPIYGSNGYDFGYCTWYVATQISVPSNWGNASSWAYYARLSGWNVSETPTPGAIAQTADAAGGEGHVAIVTAVNGSQIHVSDMNDTGDGGGFDRVGSGWVSASEYQNFITH
jgi:surface antigen